MLERIGEERRERERGVERRERGVVVVVVLMQWGKRGGGGIRKEGEGCARGVMKT